MSVRDLIESDSRSVEETKSQAGDWEIDRQNRLRQAVSDLEALQPPVFDESSERTLNELLTFFETNKGYIDSVSQRHLDLSDRINEVNRSIGALQGQITLLNSQVRVMAPAVEKPARSFDVLSTELVRLQSEESQLVSKISQINTEIQSTKTAITERDAIQTCTECGQFLSEEAKVRLFGELQSDLSRQEQELLELTQRLQSVRIRIAELNDAVVRAEAWHKYEQAVTSWKDPQPLQEQLAELESVLASLTTEKHKVSEEQQNIDKAKEKISKLSKEVEQQKRDLLQFESDKKNLQNEISRIQSESNPYLLIVQQLEQKLIGHNSSLQNLISERDRLGTECDAVAFWVEGFGNRGLKSLVLDHAIPTIESFGNTYLKYLSGGTATLRLSSTSTIATGKTRDRLSMEAVFAGGGGKYDKVSGGERRRIDLAILFALGDMGALLAKSRVKLRLLDEPFDDLDSIGCEQVIEVLKSLVVPKAGTVLVMSHNDNLKSLIDNRIVVVKERGVSRILR